VLIISVCPLKVTLWMIVNLNIKHLWNFPENYCIKGFLEILTGKTVKKSMVKKVWKNNLMHIF